MILAGADEEEEKEEQETATERWGLVWDPEEGPVWGNIGGSEGEEQEDTWTQLLRGEVSGITTDSDGEDRCHVCICYHVRSVWLNNTMAERAQHTQIDKFEKKHH